MKILALDIGGANLKVAVADNKGVREFSHYFPFWKKKNDFENFLREHVGEFLPADKVRVTMTAELADCYRTKDEGVKHILGCVGNVVPNSEALSVDGKLLSIEEASSNPYKVASANWVATSLRIAKKFKTGILIDIGSTTTDVIPVKDGGIVAKGKSDLERLQNHELIYSGILRTNVAAIVDEISMGGIPTPVSSERFAIAADVYRILGDIPEEGYACETPDGKGRGIEDCRSRIARVVCSDTNELGEEQIEKIAEFIKERQIGKISDSISNISKREGIDNAFVCGSGAFLAREAAKRVELSVEEVDISPVRALLEL